MYTFRSMILLHIYLKNVKIHDNVKIMLQLSIMVQNLVLLYSPEKLLQFDNYVTSGNTETIIRQETWV